MTDTERLREVINKSGYRIYFVADRIGLSYQGFLKKLNNETEFVASEIHALSVLLNIPVEERDAIFFADKVDVSSTKAGD